MAFSTHVGRTLELSGGDGTAASSLYGSVYLHQGLQYHLTTGLYDNRNRAYDPMLGRFLQEDPAGYVNGSDEYQMEGSDPILFVDPLGLNITVIEAEKAQLDPQYKDMTKEEFCEIDHATGDKKSGDETIDQALKYLNDVIKTEDVFKQMVAAHHVMFDGKEFTGDLKTYIGLIEREKESQYIKVNSGGPEAIYSKEKELIDKAKDGSKDYDDFAVEVHAEGGTPPLVFINGKAYDQGPVLKKVDEIGKDLKSNFISASCFRDHTGINEVDISFPTWDAPNKSATQPSDARFSFIPYHLKKTIKVMER